MIKHNLLLFFRNIKKYKVTFFINLIGLSTGLASVILIYLWVNDELKINAFHENDSHIYQVMQNLPEGDDIDTIIETPGLLARSLKSDIPEIKYASNVIAPNWFENEKGIISHEDTYFKARGQFVEKDYLKIFSWEIIQGDKNTVLTDKNTVLLSEAFAKKLFPDTTDIIGKTIDWVQESSSGKYVVNGVFKDVSNNSTAQFDVLFNYESILEANASNFKKWSNSNPETFVLLQEGSNIKQVNAKIKNYRREKYQSLRGTKYLHYIGTLFLQKYSDRYLYNVYENGVQTGGRIEYIFLFSIIAIFLLVIACINFMNLSTAKATTRLKEIGVKKVIGAHRKSLIKQFLFESLIMISFSLCVAFLTVILILPEFNHITGKSISLSLSLEVVLIILGITLVTGFIAGSYPALYLSRFRPIRILKGKLDTSIGETWARKGLVIIQFSISLILIVSVFIIHQQINFVQNKNLGYNKDNVIAISSEGNLYESNASFISEIKNIPGVLKATSFGHDLVGDAGGTGGVNWEGKDPNANIQFSNLEIDFDWFELLEIEVLQGRVFSDEYGNNEDKIIFNEAAIAIMGLKEPIGKTVKVWGKDRQIIGVVKDFHFESLHERVKPCMMQYYADLSNVLVKIKSGTENKTLSKIGAVYKEFNPGLTFEYKFIDDDYQSLYTAEKRVATLSKYFASIAFIVSCLGLFGLAAFTVEKKRKEIGIRKTLGQGTQQIVMLLSGEFMKLVFTAIAIGLPIGYLIITNWLSRFEYTIDLQISYFLIAGFTVLALACIAVGFQTVNAASRNPIDALREE